MHIAQPGWRQAKRRAATGLCLSGQLTLGLLAWSVVAAADPAFAAIHPVHHTKPAMTQAAQTPRARPAVSSRHCAAPGGGRLYRRPRDAMSTWLFAPARHAVYFTRGYGGTCLAAGGPARG